MNYRHIFHAGNFADVFKHTILVILIKALLKKEKPFCYLDTHAGIGRYDLLSSFAQKTREFDNGITRLLSQHNFPQEIKDYVNCLKELPHYYPGSPCIVRNFLRPNDRMILTELHKEDFQQLKQEFFHDKQVAVHHQDGYQGLKAFLPPAERRGLVLIDPPYEQNNEFDHLCSALASALKRWETGVYAIWYPIKSRILVNRFLHTLKDLNLKNTLRAELSIYPEEVSLALNGCGMIIINPPWQLDKQLNSLLPWLWKGLSPQGLGNYQIDWLI